MGVSVESWRARIGLFNFKYRFRNMKRECGTETFDDYMTESETPRYIMFQITFLNYFSMNVSYPEPVFDLPEKRMLYN